MNDAPKTNGTAVAPALANSWRGQRSLTRNGVTVILSANMTQIQQVFATIGATSLTNLYDMLASRQPERLEGVFLILADDNGPAVWQHLNGLQGLDEAYRKIVGVLNGLTEEEEKEAEKKRQAESDESKATEMEALIETVLKKLNSTPSPSATG